MMKLQDVVTLAVIFLGSMEAKADTAAPQLNPNGYQQITSLSTATALTVPSYSTSAVICAETANVRWRDDGTAPTTSVGMVLLAGQCFSYTGNLAVIKFIAQTDSPVLDISYYR